VFPADVRRHKCDVDLPKNHSFFDLHLGNLLRDSAAGIGKVQRRIGAAGFWALQT